MSQVRRFDDDIFISYAHIDNVPLTEGQKGWVEHFHRSLQIRLQQLLGEELKVWRDEKLQGNDYFGDTLIHRFPRIAVLVSVLSPRYLQSDWCLRELREFVRVAFVDPSGGVSDAMTLAIAHREPRDGRAIAVLDAIREITPPFSPESVVTDFAALCARYSVRAVEGDRYSGEWARESFRAHGVAYEIAASPKSDLYRDALPLINSGTVELLDVARLRAQLCALERRTARGGRDSIDHPPHQHDDLANVVAGVCVAVLAHPTRALQIFASEPSPSDTLTPDATQPGPRTAAFLRSE